MKQVAAKPDFFANFFYTPAIWNMYCGSVKIQKRERLLKKQLLVSLYKTAVL